MKILAVDDDAAARLIMEAMIRSLGHECLLAGDAAEAWRVLERGGVDVLITDRRMPRIDGLDLCRRIRAELTHTYVYVVLATSLGDEEQALEGMQAGADGYLIKPVRTFDLQLRIIAAERVVALHRLNEQHNQTLRAVARLDPLTGLGNRLRLQEDVETLSARVIRYGHQYSVAILDVDYFKAYNDEYGHLAGDQALQAVAEAITRVARASDSCYRFGGEEFLCIFPEQTAVSTAIVVERILDAISGLDIRHTGSPRYGCLTASAGIAQMTAHSSPDAVLQQADKALYQAKHAGRNTFRQADLPVPQAV